MQEQGLVTSSDPRMQALGPGAPVEIRGPAIDGMESVLTPEALPFLLELHERSTHGLPELLADRGERQAEYDAGILPDVDPLTAAVRAEEWGVAPNPAEFLDRRVEFTGPAERKMIINALNSGAKVCMA